MQIVITIDSPDLGKLAEALVTLATELVVEVKNLKGIQTPVNVSVTPQIQPPPAPMATTSAPVPPAPESVAVVPTTAPAYTMEQLAVAATQLVDAGRRAELVQLLTSFGVQALTALPKESYGAFATQLRAMGAKI